MTSPAKPPAHPPDSPFPFAPEADRAHQIAIRLTALAGEIAIHDLTDFEILDRVDRILEETPDD